jgi:hypothetical protein
MTDTDQSVPNDATNKTTDLKQPEIKPLRTMRGDIAELLAQNTLSPTELKSIQTQLQDEARAYHAQGGDERYLENLLPKQKETDINALFSSRGAIKKPESDADLFIQKTTAEIIAEQIPKARQKTEELKQAVSQTPPVPTPPVAQIKIPEAPKAPTPPVPPVVTPVKKEEPPVPIQKAPEIKIPPVDPLIAEEKELTIAFSTFPEKERVLFEAVKKLATERAGFEALLAPLLEEERVLEEKENSLHLEEARAEGVTARRHLEEERWQIEDRRRAIEQKRWKVDQEIIRIQNNANTLDAEKNKLAAEKESLNERKNLLEKKKRARTALADHKRLEEELARFAGEKEPLEVSWIELNEKQKASINELERIRTTERALEETIAESEIAERKTISPEERHTFESRRWKAEEDRRNLEKKRWQIEDSLGTLEESAKVLKERYQKILARENDVKKQIEALQNLISEVRQLS